MTSVTPSGDSGPTVEVPITLCIFFPLPSCSLVSRKAFLSHADKMCCGLSSG